MDSFLAKPLKLQGNVHTSYLNENCVFIGTGQTSKTSWRSYPLSPRARCVPSHDFTTIYYIYFALVSDGTTTCFVYLSNVFMHHIAFLPISLYFHLSLFNIYIYLLYLSQPPIIIIIIFYSPVTPLSRSSRPIAPNSEISKENLNQTSNPDPDRFTENTSHLLSPDGLGCVGVRHYYTT